MRYVIDRFEEELAICEAEDRETISVSKKDLPDSAKEGDVIVLKDERWELDSEGTKARRDRIKKKMMELFE